MPPPMGLPAGYGNAMFTNMQAANQAQTKNTNQNTIDNARNPGMSGVVAAGVNSNNQAGADRGMQNQTEGQLAGAQAGFQADQASQSRAFQGQQATQEQQAAFSRLQQQTAAASALQKEGFAGQSSLMNQRALLDLPLTALGG